MSFRITLFPRRTALTPKQIRLVALLLQQEHEQELLQEFTNDLAQKNKERKILTKQGLPFMKEIILPLFLCLCFVGESFGGLIINNWNNDEIPTEGNLKAPIGLGDEFSFSEEVELKTILLRGRRFSGVVTTIVYDEAFSQIADFTVTPKLFSYEFENLFFNFSIVIPQGKYYFATYSSRGYLANGAKMGIEYTLGTTKMVPRLSPSYVISGNSTAVPECPNSIWVWVGSFGSALIMAGRHFHNRKQV